MNYPHVAPEFRAIVDDSTERRCKAIYSERVVAHRALTEILDFVMYQVSLPKQTRAWGLLVNAPPGAGKTQLGLAVAKRLRQIQVGETRINVPVVSISMTGAREARVIFSRILDAMKVPVSPNLRVSDQESLALDLLTTAKVRLLILDEIQDVLSSTKRQQRAALDAIKLIMNKLGIPVLCLGTAKTAEVMHQDPHLAARFIQKTLPVWKIDESTQELLRALEKGLPLQKASYLSSPGTTELIIKKTNGSLAKIVRLVNIAALFAIQTGKERIDHEIIEMAQTGIPDPKLLSLCLADSVREDN